MTKKRSAPSAELCSCGHVHARGQLCGAVVSGSPNLTYCQCPGCLPNGEHVSKEAVASRILHG